MPELPEVETVKNALTKYAINKTIINVIFKTHNIVLDEEKEFTKNVNNATILSLERIGKFLIFHLNNKKVIISHLRMEGKWIPGKDKEDISKYARVIFEFKDGSILNYDDSRMFGILLIKKENNYKDVPPLSLLGKEAISDIKIDDVYPIINKDKRCIKEVLLDQSIISGLGNIYVDETLYASKISPFSDANKLNKKQVETILKEAKRILLSSIKNNGSTIHSFTWDQGKSGGFQKFLKIYGKKGETCQVCKNEFVKTFIKGRGTTYCPKCQKLYADKYVLGITGTISSGKSTALNMLKDLGYYIFSCDEEVGKLYCDDSFKNELAKKFKTSKKEDIRNIVKNDNKQLDKLNKLIHPIIKKKAANFIKSIKKGRIAIEAPLLFESNMDIMMDETLFITSKNSEKYIKNRGEKGKAQLEIYNKKKHNNIKKATYVIHNDYSKETLKKKIKELFNK